MAISGISSAYSSYYNQNLMNVMRSAGVYGSNSSQYLGAVKRISGVERNQSTYGSTVDFLNQYRSELLGLEEASSKLGASGSKSVFEDYGVTTSDSSVVQAGKGYQLKEGTEIALQVDSLAQAQKNVTASHYGQEQTAQGSAMEFTVSDGARELQVKIGDVNQNGTQKTYQQMYQEAADAINSYSQLGVRAEVVNTEGKVSLSITSKATGSEKGFTVSGTMGAAEGLDQVQDEGRDAQYTVTQDGATQSFQSASNKISLDYGRINATLEGTGEAVIKTEPDQDQVVDAVADFVDQYNSVLGLLGDNSSRGTGAANQLAAFQRGIADEKTLKAVGISINKDGDLTLDEEALKKAMDEDMQSVKDILGGQFGLASRTASRAKTALDTPVQRLVNNDLPSAEESGNSNYGQDGNDYMFRSFANFARGGAYNLSNYYTVGLMLNVLA